VGKSCREGPQGQKEEGEDGFFWETVSSKGARSIRRTSEGVRANAHTEKFKSIERTEN